MDAKPVSFLLATALHAPLLYGVYAGVNSTIPEKKSIAVEIMPMQTAPQKQIILPTRKQARQKRPQSTMRIATQPASSQPAQMPMVLRAIKPHYPREARRQGLEGVVHVQTKVNSAGLPTGVNIAKSCGHKLLDAAAVTAVGQWRFQKQIPSKEVIVPVTFRLKP